MCHWYAHQYTCKHTAYALGKYCGSGGFVQTPCKTKNIWQTIRMGEACEDCGVPEEKVSLSAKPKTVKVKKVWRRR
jgi:hypothetical protein